MQRGRSNTVTQIPILIPAEGGAGEGQATFLTEFKIRPVRALRNADIKNAKKVLSDEEAKHFSAVMMLKQALEKGPDRLATEKAMAALSETYHQLAKSRKTERGEVIGRSQEHLGPQFKQALFDYLGLPPDECWEVFEGLKPGPRARRDPHWMLSLAISEALADARFVLWRTDNRFTPAVWCKDLRTAFYARALLSTAGVKGIRICPYCADLFPQYRSDQNYCCIAHREAHRVARWRAQKRAAKETHVPRKTR